MTRLNCLAAAFLMGCASACAAGTAEQSPKTPAPASPAGEIESEGVSGAANGEPSTAAESQSKDAADVDPVEAAMSASDRSAQDRELDGQRKSGELLRFFQIKPKQRVAELGVGTGYTTELLARVVGPDGKVFAQNSQFILDRFAEGPWSERLKKPVMAPVERVDRPFDDPLPESADNLDAVVNVLFYHDSVWMKVDRDKMNQAVFAALKPGGIYGIVDHDATAGAGTSHTKKYHRIEKQFVIDEIKRAGFVLEAEGDMLENPSDTRDWNAAPSKAAERRGTSHRFVLRFRKPR